MSDYDPILEELKYTRLQVVFADKTLEEYKLLREQSRHPEQYDTLIESMEELHDTYQQKIKDILNGQL